MVKRSPNYVLILAIFIIAGAFNIWISSKPVAARFSVDFNKFPKVIDSYVGEDIPLDDEVKAGIEADEVLSREYFDEETGSRVGVLVVYRKYGRRGFVHRPEMCYPAAGYEIISKHYTKIRYNGQEIDAMQIIAQKEGDREVLLYWYNSGDRMVASYMKQQYLMALDRLQPQHYGWAFIRLNSPVIISDQQTLKEMQAFLDKASKPLVKCLTGRNSSNSESVK